jgi:hypothetical protein
VRTVGGRAFTYRGPMSDDRTPLRVTPVTECGTRSAFGLYLLVHALGHRRGDITTPGQWPRALVDTAPIH